MFFRAAARSDLPASPSPSCQAAGTGPSALWPPKVGHPLQSLPQRDPSGRPQSSLKKAWLVPSSFESPLRIFQNERGQLTPVFLSSDLVQIEVAGSGNQFKMLFLGSQSVKISSSECRWDFLVVGAMRHKNGAGNLSCNILRVGGKRMEISY